MNRFIAPLALALVVALSGAASADPVQNEGLRIAAGTSALTPHGVFDGR